MTLDHRKPSEEIVFLPGNLQLMYLNEGAANVVYRISLPPSTPDSEISEEYGPNTPLPSEVEAFPDERHAIVQNKLLRLRKDLPTSLEVAVSQLNFVNHISPLFPPSSLVTQSLALLPPLLIADLNEQLREFEASDRRKLKRRGSFLAKDCHGLLITDMTPQHPGERLVEFKPKWLLQSTTAPADAVRCRQCAQNAMKNFKSEVRDDREHFPLYCPLDFFSAEPDVVRNLAGRLLTIGGDQNQDLQDRLTNWLRGNQLLLKLRETQRRLMQESFGVEKEDSEAIESLCTLMTLRDCTIFLRFKVGDREGGKDLDGGVEAKIGDLDLKSSGKIKSWMQCEEELNQGGWYRGLEDRKQPNICALSRHL